MTETSKFRVEGGEGGGGRESCNFAGINDGAVDDSVRLWADDILPSRLGAPLFYNGKIFWGWQSAGI